MPYPGEGSPLKPEALRPTRKRGVRAPPTYREPAKSLRPLNAGESVQERLEERRLRRSWDEGNLPKPMKGLW